MPATASARPEILGSISLKAKLTAAFAAALLLVLALVGLFVYLQIQRDLQDSFDTGLSSRADDLAALVASSGDREPSLGAARIGDSEDSFSQILTPEGAVVSSTLPPASGALLDSDQVARAATGAVFVDIPSVPGVEGGDARLLVRPARSATGELVVVAGSNTEDRRETLAGVLRAFLIGAPLALILASVLGYLLASRALKPVEAMRRRAGAITLERSGERLPLPRADDEIRALGETLNSMLDRIEASLERERVFVADASHELRTPLAILRAELELAAKPERSREELRKALASAAEEVDRLSRLAEDLLVIARSDQGRLPISTGPTDLLDLLRRVETRFERLASEGGREILIDAPEALVASVDDMRMEQAVGNLIDNALRHGAGSVRLRARKNGADAIIEVADEGAGFSPEFKGRAFDRFTRADPGRTGAGAGLGLAISRAIAVAHGGDTTIVESGDSMTVVRITVPLN